MVKQAFYAVKNGREVGIFNTWDECQKSINGFSGAVYKKFKALKEAEFFIEDKEIETTEVETKDSNVVTAYVDGSFIEGIDRYAYGLLLILPNGERIEDSGYQDKEEALISRNVAGELLGAMIAIEKTSQLGYENLIIIHDYEGIARWYKGEWKAKSYVAIEYLKFVDKYRGKIKVNFEWVKGHSGDANNDLVDRLAKDALGQTETTKFGENYLVINRFKNYDFKSILELVTEDLAEEGKKLLITEDEKDNLFVWRLRQDKNKLTVIIYKDNEKLLVQGAQNELFVIIQTYLLELVDDKTIHKVLKESYQLNIGEEAVELSFYKYLPNLNDSLLVSDKLKRTMKQSVYNLHIDGKMQEYTYLAFPALRALEGFLKQVLKKHNIECKKSFNMFEPKPGDKDNHQLKKTFHSKIGSPGKIRYINKTYNFYNKNRHTLFHWDEYDGQVDTTRTLTENAWKGTIRDTLDLINEYYITN